MLGDSADEIACKVVGVDEALALARDLVLGVSVLLRVRDEHAVADRLDAEGRVAARQRRIDEAAVRHQAEAPVEHVYLGVVEVGRIEARAGHGVRNRETLVDRTVIEVRDHDRVGSPVPAEHLPLLGIEEEQRLSPVRQDKAGGRIEDGARRRVVHVHNERVAQRERHTVGSAIERRLVGAVVRHPPRARRARGQSPGIDEVRIGVRRDARLVGDQRHHAERCAFGCPQRRNGHDRHPEHESQREQHSPNVDGKLSHSHPPLVVLSSVREGRESGFSSRRWDSNPRPTPYKGVALTS